LTRSNLKNNGVYYPDIQVVNVRNRNETLCYLAGQLVALKVELLHDDSHRRASVVINQAYDNVRDDVGSAMNSSALQT
jgi:hypothetical protein